MPEPTGDRAGVRRARPANRAGSALALAAAAGLAVLPAGAQPAAGPTFVERDGQVVVEAESHTAMTGAWRRVADGAGRTVMRMNGPDGRMFEGRHMYLAYRVCFTRTGRYRLWGLMRSSGTKATDDVWVYWNREPGGTSREDFELKVESREFAWSRTFKDLPPPEPPSKRPKNRDLAEHGFPVGAPGVYVLYIAKGEEPFGPDHTLGTDADFYAFDRFALIHADRDARPAGDGPPESARLQPGERCGGGDVRLPGAAIRPGR